MPKTRKHERTKIESSPFFSIWQPTISEKLCAKKLKKKKSIQIQDGGHNDVIRRHHYSQAIWEIWVRRLRDFFFLSILAASYSKQNENHVLFILVSHPFFRRFEIDSLFGVQMHYLIIFNKIDSKK